MTTGKRRSPMLLVPLFVAASVVVYMMLLKPCMAKLKSEEAVLRDLRSRQETMRNDLRSKVEIVEKINRAEENLAKLGSLELEPLLESYAMRAKSMIGDYAAKAGLIDAEFSNRSPLALPVVPGRVVPDQLHARMPILMSCSGDYAAIVSFIMRVERDLPFVSLGALKIVSNRLNPDLQLAEITLEWPIRGAVVK